MVVMMEVVVITEETVVVEEMEAVAGIKDSSAIPVVVGRAMHRICMVKSRPSASHIRHEDFGGYSRFLVFKNQKSTSIS